VRTGLLLRVGVALAAPSVTRSPSERGCPARNQRRIATQASGPNHELTVVEDPARRALSIWDQRVVHLEVAADLV